MFPRRVFVLLASSACWLGSPTHAAAPYGLSSRLPIGSFLDDKMPATRPSSSDYTVVDAFPNLTFNDPTFFTFDPGTNRLYVCGRQGTIHSFVNNPNVTTRTLFLDLRSRTQGNEDCGLLGMAFHPQWRKPGSPNRGYVYVYYQYSTNPIATGPNGRPYPYVGSWNRLSRFTVADNSLVANPASETILINQFDRHLWHNGGSMFFGDDGFLYLINGDEGGAEDEFDQTQKLDGGLFSGVLRIDVDRDPTRSHPIRRQPRSPPGSPPSFSTNYFIPNDNPWQDPSGGILEEFWAIGLRSPHRMTFDPVSKQIWVGDVGQVTREEINLIERGGNYQWPYKEGTFPGFKPMPSPLIGTDKPPVFDYHHANGDNCVIGGYVYRGASLPELNGKYIFGDNGSGRVWALGYNGPNAAPSVTYLCNIPPGTDYTGLSSFGIDRNNELYLCQMGSNGKIYRLARSGPVASPAPRLLSQTGAFTDTANLVSAAGLIPYTVNSPLWSDAAIKTRWMAVPNDGAPFTGDEQVAFAPTGEWSFPGGTVFVKHFELPINETNPLMRRRLETRLLVRDNYGGAYGLTYKWRGDNSDAELLDDSLHEEIPIQTATGIRTQTWYYPSPLDCLACHNPNANHVLGVKTRQLNGEFVYPGGAADNQLRALNSIGLFSPALSESAISNYTRTVALTDTSAPLDTRVRSYLDANCAQCHRPDGVQANFDARFDTPLADQHILNGPLFNSLGIMNSRVAAPGNLERSVILHRVNTNGQLKMPPLARNLIDSNAVAALADWIMSFAPGPLPWPWQHHDIGPVLMAGDAGYTSNGSIFNVTGAGADIWDPADEFHYVYQPVSGDCEIVARVTSVADTDPWAKAGVMIRENLSPTSANALVALTSRNGAEFQWRRANDGFTSYIQGHAVTAPQWVRLVRQGSLLSAYNSHDATNWVWIGSTNVVMPASVTIGLAVTSVNSTSINAASFDFVRVTTAAAPPAPLPAPWQQQNIGSATLLGGATYTNGTFHVSTAGTNIFGPRDAFHFVFQPVTNDWAIVAQVLSGPAGPPWAKAGVMLRETLAPDSLNAFVALGKMGGASFQWRDVAGGSTLSVAGPSVGAPYWLRLTRATNMLTAHGSSDGTNWLRIGATNVALASELLAGLAVTALDSTGVATAAFTNVQIVAASVSPSADSDFDGMPDIYELANGFDPTDASDAAQDADADGLTNLKEFLAGTNPRDSQSVLKILDLFRTGNDVVFRLIGGTGRTYAIEQNTSLPASVWSPLTNIFFGTNTGASVTNPGAGRSDRGYFRVRLVP